MGGGALRLLALPGTYIFATDSNVNRLLHDGTLNSPEWWVCSSENSISVISLTSGHDSSQKKNLNWWVTAGYLKAKIFHRSALFFSETKVRNFEFADWLFGSWRSMESKTEGPNTSREFAQQLWLTTPPKQKAKDNKSSCCLRRSSPIKSSSRPGMTPFARKSTQQQ